MGVRGLTTFIANRSRDYLETYQLHDTYLVIDGYSIASQLYNWHCKCNDCFGGDYDKYKNTVTNFFQLLSKCNIKPLIVFDGGYEYRKLQTVYDRMKSRIKSANGLNTVTEGSLSVFPLFLRDLFVDIALKLDIKCVRCDFEGDSEAAYLAQTLSCPLLSYDSDFYIFDVLYIPFITVDLHIVQTKDKSTNTLINYIPCQVYRIEKFLNSFGGLDKVNLPILAVLLGNDYIKKSVLATFHRQLKLQNTRTKQNNQQRRIKTVIMWLKNHTPETAITAILSKFKLKRRKLLAKRIQSVINGYCCDNSNILKYLNIEVPKPKDRLELSVFDNVEAIPDDDEQIDDDDDDDCVNLSENDDDDDDVDDNINEDLEETNALNLPQFFHENFRKCLYPSCFIDMITRDTYYCIPQVEDYHQEQSHSICLRIISAIHEILTSGRSNGLNCICRNGSSIRRSKLQVYNRKLPILEQIEFLTIDERRRLFLNILNIDSVEFLTEFPKSWHLYLISMKFWLKNNKNKIELTYIYSIILCGIVLNYVDKNIGFYRSNKAFFNKYGKFDEKIEAIIVTNIRESIENIDNNNSINCMKQVIQNFQMDAKMKTNLKLFDRCIVHNFAKFQSCLLHIRYLNCLLKFPFDSFIISDFYDGTFLYNITTNFLKRGNLKAYTTTLLGQSPAVLNTLNLMVDCILREVDGNVDESVCVKKRRRRKKKTVDDNTDNNQTDNDENENIDDSYDDENNLYSILSTVNK